MAGKPTLRRKSLRKRSDPSRRAKSHRTLTFESLETRTVLSASFPVTTITIELPEGCDTDSSFNPKDPANSKTGYELLELAKYYSHLSEKGHSSEVQADPGYCILVTNNLRLYQIEGDSILIEALASGAASDLETDLEALGATKIVSYSRLVNALLPFSSIKELASLESLQFARPAYGAITHPFPILAEGVAKETPEIDLDSVQRFFPGSPIVFSGHKPQADADPTYDAGEYYWYHSEKVPLQRLLDQVVVGFANEEIAQSSLESLTGAGGLLSGWEVAQKAENTAVVLKNPYWNCTSSVTENIALERLLDQITDQEGVSWSGPKFYSERFNSWAVATDRISVRLRPGVDPDSFFDDSFSSYKRIGGTLNTYSGKLNKGGALSVLEKAEELRSDPRVTSVSPIFYSDIRSQGSPDSLSLRSAEVDLIHTGYREPSKMVYAQEDVERNEAIDDSIAAVLADQLGRSTGIPSGKLAEIRSSEVHRSPLDSFLNRDPIQTHFAKENTFLLLTPLDSHADVSEPKALSHSQQTDCSQEIIDQVARGTQDPESRSELGMRHDVLFDALGSVLEDSE